MKVITDLATGRDSPQRWVMLALTPLLISHEALEESAHGSFKWTLLSPLFLFPQKQLVSLLSYTKTHQKREKLWCNPINTPKEANDWLALDQAESCTVLFKQCDCSEVSQTSRQTLVRPAHTVCNIKLAKDNPSG